MIFNLIGKAVKELRLPTVGYENTPAKVIHAKQNDTNSRYFSVVLYDDRGDIDLSVYTRATLNANVTEEDDTQLIIADIDTESNRVICKIASGIIAVPGRVSCDILLTGVGESNEPISLTSQTFYIIVDEGQGSNSAIEASDELSLIAQLLTEIDAMKKDIEELRNN